MYYTMTTISWTQQNATFNTTSIDASPAIAVDSAGSLILVYSATGTSSGGTSIGGQDIVVSKLNQLTGTVIWTRQLPNFNTTTSDTVPQLAIDSSNNIVLAYVTSGGEVSGGTSLGSNDVVIVKLDGNTGTIIWTQQNESFNTIAYESQPQVVINSNDDIFFVYISTGTTSGGTNISSTDIVLAKLNGLNGLTFWTRQTALFNTSSNEGFPSIAINSDGDVFCSYASTGQVSGGTKTESGSDIVLAKFKGTDGSLLYTSQYPAFNTGYDDNSPSIAVDNNGDVIVAYNSSDYPAIQVSGGTDTGYIVFTYAGFNAQYADIIVVKFQGNTGNVIWVRQDPNFNTGGNDLFVSLDTNSNGDIWFAYSTTGQQVSGGTHLGSSDIVLVKLSGNDGSTIQTVQNPQFNTTGYGGAPTLVTGNSNDVYFAYSGRSGAVSGGTNIGGDDIVVVKLLDNSFTLAPEPELDLGSASGLFILTPRTPCGLGTFKIGCCPIILSNLDFTDSSTIAEIRLSQSYINLWCCISQNLRQIDHFFKDYFCSSTKSESITTKKNIKGTLTDQSQCNQFKNNAIKKSKYISIANASLSIAEAVDVYVAALTQALAKGEDDLAKLTVETINILKLMNSLIPCIHLQRTSNSSLVTTWFTAF